MDKILELSESLNNKYPQHFHVFLNNCVKTYSENFGPNDYLFAAVYFLVMETGFSPAHAAGGESVGFDIRKIRCVTGYTDDQIKISVSPSTEKYYVYKILLKLGQYNLSLCELQGVPSSELNAHLIINFLLKNSQAVKSLCLKTDFYIDKNTVSSEHKYVLKNLKALSLNIKNKLAIEIKDMILTNEEEGCSANLLCLPEEIQKKIIYFLAESPASVQALSSTCSYFYSFITKDTKLWEEMCFKEFSGWVLNKALQELCITGDANVFRSAFLFLKKQETSV